MADKNSQHRTNQHNNPSTSQEQITEETFDTQSVASSASELQMSLLENKLENEMAKMANIVKDTVSSLQQSVSSLTERFEKKFSEVEQKLSSLAADRVVLANQNTNRSTSLCGQTSNIDTQNRGDNILPLFAHSNQSCLSSTIITACNTQSIGNNVSPLFVQSNQSCGSLGTINTSHTQSKGDNISSMFAQPKQSFVSSATNSASNIQPEQSKVDNNNFKMKPQTFNGTDFDDFISQYEITCEINKWQYKEKSLYLANCLTGDARSLLNELDYEGKRDYNTLVEKLRNRFGSVNKSEIFRTQLKSRTRNKGETIPELSQAIKKLVRQAYPGVNKEVIETLSLDNFVDAINDSEIRLRLREAGPKSLAEAEQIAARIEAYKIADKQRSRLVGRVDFEVEQNKEEQGKPPVQIETLSEAISTLTKEVKNIGKGNRNGTNNGSFYNQKQANRNQNNNQNYNRNQRFQRPYQNNQNRQNDYGRPRFNGRYRGNNSYQANPSGIRGQNTPNEQNLTNQNFTPRTENNSSNRNDVNQVSGFQQASNPQENSNLSAWGATTRQH